MNYSTHLLRHLRFTIGQNIHKQRVRQKMPLHKLSKLSNIPEKSLDFYELGKGEINIMEMLKIACILQVGTKELFG